MHSAMLDPNRLALHLLYWEMFNANLGNSHYVELAERENFVRIPRAQFEIDAFIFF